MKVAFLLITELTTGENKIGGVSDELSKEEFIFKSKHEIILPRSSELAEGAHLAVM